jgi:hypothetical protein
LCYFEQKKTRPVGLRVRTRDDDAVYRRATFRADAEGVAGKVVATSDAKAASNSLLVIPRATKQNYYRDHPDENHDPNHACQQLKRRGEAVDNHVRCHEQKSDDQQSDE